MIGRFTAVLGTAVLGAAFLGCYHSTPTHASRWVPRRRTIQRFHSRPGRPGFWWSYRPGTCTRDRRSKSPLSWPRALPSRAAYRDSAECRCSSRLERGIKEQRSAINVSITFADTLSRRAHDIHVDILDRIIWHRHIRNKRIWHRHI